uniref:Uncharacterized protein n=1 Tax=Biomphalaria glabrata TaxID=6526 RepID=A0A2C9L2U6_BIOGL
MTASIYICLSALSIIFCNNVLVLSQQTNPVDANRYVNPTYQIQSAGSLPPQPLAYDGNPPLHNVPPLFPNVPPLFPNVPPLFPNVPPLFPNTQPSAYSGNVPTHHVPPLFPNVPPLFPNAPPPQPPPPPLPMPPPLLSITPPSTLVAPPPNAQIPSQNEMRHAVFHHPPIENTPQHSVNATSGPSLSPVNLPKLTLQELNSKPSQTQYQTVQSQQQELIKKNSAMKKAIERSLFH